MSKPVSTEIFPVLFPDVRLLILQGRNNEMYITLTVIDPKDEMKDIPVQTYLMTK
jgi:hypothetical protein